MKRLAGQDRSFLFFHKTMGRHDASGRSSSGLSQSTMRGLCRKGWGPWAGRSRMLGIALRLRPESPHADCRDHRLWTTCALEGWGRKRFVAYEEEDSVAAALEVAWWKGSYTVFFTQRARRMPASFLAKAVMA